MTVDKILNYLNEFGPAATIKEYEEKVLNLNNPELSYYFAANVPGCNLKAHEQIVRNSRNVQYIYLFADIKGADAKSLLNLIKENVTYNNPSHDGKPDLNADALDRISISNPSRDVTEPKIK